MDTLIEQIKEARPRLRPTSIKSYISHLKKLNKEVGNSDDLFDLGVIKKKEKIMEFLSSKAKSTRRNYLSSLVVLSMLDEKLEKLTNFYRENMELLGNELMEEQKKQTKSAKQEANWTELDELMNVLADYKKQIDKKKLLKENALTKSEFDLIQKWVAGSLYVSDVNNNPPLRADFADTKIISMKEYNELSDDDLKNNYLVVKSRVKKFLHLGQYKTEGKYGYKIIPMGPTLNKILNAWLRVNKTGWLLVDSQDKPMSPNQLTKYIIKVFEPTGKSIGISLIRHIVISHLFPADLQKKQDIADKMAHSVDLQTMYAKQ